MLAIEEDVTHQIFHPIRNNDRIYLYMRPRSFLASSSAYNFINSNNSVDRCFESAVKNGIIFG